MGADWVYVGGTFDLFHPGHVNLLAKARELGPVVVALNTDDFAERYKRRPIMRLEERQRVLEACKYVDKVVANIGSEDSWKTIDWLRKDRGFSIRYIVHGDDWVGPGLMSQMGLTHGGLAAVGIELVHFPYTEGVSSGDIINRVLHENTPKGESLVGVCCGDPGDCGDCGGVGC